MLSTKGLVNNIYTGPIPQSPESSPCVSAAAAGRRGGKPTALPGKGAGDTREEGGPGSRGNLCCMGLLAFAQTHPVRMPTFVISAYYCQKCRAVLCILISQIKDR